VVLAGLDFRFIWPIPEANAAKAVVTTGTPRAKRDYRDRTAAQRADCLRGVSVVISIEIALSKNNSRTPARRLYTDCLRFSSAGTLRLDRAQAELPQILGVAVHELWRWKGTSFSCRLQRCWISRAMSSDTSWDQRSAVLNATTLIGRRYSPDIRSWMTVSRSAVSMSRARGCRHARIVHYEIDGWLICRDNRRGPAGLTHTQLHQKNRDLIWRTDSFQKPGAGAARERPSK
jgi:hypothetical protein